MSDSASGLASASAASGVVHAKDLQRLLNPGEQSISRCRRAAR